MKTIRIITILLLALSFSLTTTQAQEKITVAGATTVKPVIEKAASIFKSKNSGVDFAIGGGGSGKGVKACASGQVMIGMASRALKDTEKTSYPDMVATRIGVDGVAIIVNGKNTISGLTSQQVKGIFTGAITNWSQVGGIDGAITVICEPPDYGTFGVFTKHFGIDADDIAASMRIGEMPRLTSSVMTKANAITYASLGVAEQLAKKSDRIKLISLDGVEATTENVVDGTYTLSRPLLVLTNSAPSGTVKAFIDFLMSDDGQKIVKEHDYIPVG